VPDKTIKQGAAPKTVPKYGEAMQRSHGDFVRRSKARYGVKKKAPPLRRRVKT